MIKGKVLKVQLNPTTPMQYTIKTIVPKADFYTIGIHGKPLPLYRRKAWTGGNGKYEGCTHPDFEWLRRFFFREQVKDSGGLDFWACAGTTALERARIFWRRASLDAFATLNLN